MTRFFLGRVIGPHLDGDGWKGWLVIFVAASWITAIAAIFGLGLLFLWLARAIGVI